MRKFLRPIIVVLLFRVNWRKLFVIDTILTVLRVIFQIYSLPNPLTQSIISPSLDVSSYQRLNHHGKNSRELSVTSDNQLKMSKHLPAVVSLNSTARTNRSMRILARRERLLRHRRQKRARLVETIIYPPPPTVVPDHLQRFIAALKPNEALAYARSELEKAPLVTDDPDLYAPLFRNISIFKRYDRLQFLK